MTRIVQSTLALLLASAFCLAHAATLPYQGLATDAKSNPKADGSYPVDFALYSAASGGTALWSESQTVTTSKGLFSTTLGAVSTIPDSLFRGAALYLGVRFDGGSEGGRMLLGTTPWATASGKARYADSAGSVAGLSDSVSALRTALAGQSAVVSALSTTVTAQGAQLASKDSVRASHLADSAKVAVGLVDSVSALRTALAGQSAVVSSLNATVAAQGTQLAAKDSVRASHLADSAKVTVGLADSLQAVRVVLSSQGGLIAGVQASVASLTARDSLGKAHLADSTRASRKADTAKVAWHVIGYDSVLIKADSIAARTARDSVRILSDTLAKTRDSLAKLTVRVRADSAFLKASRDSIALLASRIRGDSTLLRLDSSGLKKARDSIQTLRGMLEILSGSVRELVFPSLAWKSGVDYGTIYDKRDGRIYRTVTVAYKSKSGSASSRTLMAENLAYDTASGTESWCYDDSRDSCSRYGRLYSWRVAAGGARAWSTQDPSGVRGICPEGWHMPSDAEWTGLLTIIAQLTGSTTNAGHLLKAQSLWVQRVDGVDSYGFRALPSGSRTNAGAYAGSGTQAGYWSTGSQATAWMLTVPRAVNEDEFAKATTGAMGLSLRCFQD